MTAKLLIREVGAREFVQHNGDFEDMPQLKETQASDPTFPWLTGEELAMAQGEKMTIDGNVEAFQVWTLQAAKQRTWKLEDIT